VTVKADFFFLKVLIFGAVLSFIGGCAGDLADRGGLASKGEPWPASLIDTPNTWRGGFLGGALGEPFSARISEVAGRAGGEAARSGKPVVYLSVDDFQRIEVFPLEGETKTNCRSLRQKIFQTGTMMRESVVEVCL
jgi:hypothetical protein